MTSLFYFTYRTLIWPLLSLAFRLLSFLNPKIREGLRMRESITSSSGRKIAPWLDIEKDLQPIWIHCASGEFEYAKPVIARLKQKHPDCKILVTYFSPSIANAVKKFSGIDFSTPVPWDQKHTMDEFIKWHRPKCLLIARTDTWPEMLRSAKQNQVPSLLFSATLPKSAGRATGFGAWAARSMFENLTEIYCVSSDDQAVFAALGFGAVTKVRGDTRYDQVQERLKNPRPLKTELFNESDLPQLIAGSTWSEDEAVLIEVAAALREQIRFVIVPHEPTVTHVAELTRWIEKAGLKTALYSTALARPPDAHVLIVDQIGILAELYQTGRFAFVGGSYRKTVHSVMEPLAAGCITFVGPLHLNNREAIEFSKIAIPSNSDLACVEVAKDAADFTARLRSAMRAPSSAAEFIRKEITERSGKSDLVVSWSQDHVR